MEAKTKIVGEIFRAIPSLQFDGINNSLKLKVANEIYELFNQQTASLQQENERLKEALLIAKNELLSFMPITGVLDILTNALNNSDHFNKQYQ